MPDTVVVSSKNSSDRQTLSEDFRNALEVIMYCATRYVLNTGSPLA